MVSRSTVRLVFVAGLAALAAACATAKSTPGEDPRTGTNASIVTWADGKEAIAISCNEPGSCQTRAGEHAVARRSDGGARCGLGRDSLRQVGAHFLTRAGQRDRREPQAVAISGCEVLASAPEGRAA